MDTTPYLNGDWQWADDPQTVTYFARTTAAKPTTGGVSVDNAWRTAVDKEDSPLVGGVGKKQAAVWHLWAAKLGGVVPKIGGVVEGADGARWTVKMVRVCDENERFRCVCVREQG